MPPLTLAADVPWKSLCKVQLGDPEAAKFKQARLRPRPTRSLSLSPTLAPSLPRALTLSLTLTLTLTPTLS